MFSTELENLTLANSIANNLFSNITANRFGTDKSFSATLRALLRKRLPDGQSVKVTLVPLIHSIDPLSSASPDACMRSFMSDIENVSIRESSRIRIVYFSGKEAGQRMLNIVQATAGKHMARYVPQKDLQLFYVKMLDGLFYIDAACKDTIIFVDSLDSKKLHALQMMIPKYLPWLFEDSPLSLEETALLKSLSLKNSSEYERLIEMFAADFDMRSEVIRSRLSEFETVFERLQMDEVSQTIARYEQEYQDYLEGIRTALDTIQHQKILLAGLKCKVAEAADESEIMEYFLCNKNLSVIHVSGTELEFAVHGYADIYDADAFEIYVRNHSGYLYSSLDSRITKPQMERLYRAIFSEGKYKLRVCAAYRADMRNSIKPVQNYSFPPESMTYLPNPHIQHFGCIGGYASRFQEYMHKRDYVGAIDQAMVSARNLNFHDSAVMGQLAQDLSSTKIQCIEDENGRLMTPREAIKTLEGDAPCQDPS